MLRCTIVNMIVGMAMPLPGTVHAANDPADAGWHQCLDTPAHASTAGQVRCTVDATRGYDRRMNRAYAALIAALDPVPRERLRIAQRAWIAFRDAEARSRSAFHATRRGTMYVPMEAAAAMAIVRDRALQLESMLRVARIEG